MGSGYKVGDENEVYFLTCTVVDWIDVFTRPEYKYIITDSLNYCIKHKGLDVFAWVLMTNHLHLLARAREGSALTHILRDFKKFTSKRLSEKILEIGESRREWMLDKFSFIARQTKRADHYKVWRDGNHPILMQHPGWVEQRINYIHQNPVRQEIVVNPEDYKFSSAVDYSGEKGLVDVVLV